MATKTTKTKKSSARKDTATKAPASAKAKATASADGKTNKLSAIDAAAQVLAGTKGAMNCKELIEALAAKKLWASPGGKTPHATLYSAILREIATKGKDSRFKKTARGKFAAIA
jgi:hypothetical protein